MPPESVQVVRGASRVRSDLRQQVARAKRTRPAGVRPRHPWRSCSRAGYVLRRVHVFSTCRRRKSGDAILASLSGFAMNARTPVLCTLGPMWMHDSYTDAESTIQTRIVIDTIRHLESNWVAISDRCSQCSRSRRGLVAGHPTTDDTQPNISHSLLAADQDPLRSESGRPDQVESTRPVQREFRCTLTRKRAGSSSMHQGRQPQVQCFVEPAQVHLLVGKRHVDHASIPC